MEPGYLTIDQLSKYLNIKRTTLYNKVETGDLPHYRVGRLIRFRIEDINFWMEGHKRDIIDSNLRAKDILKTIDRPNLDIDRIVKKSIDEVKGKRYTPSNGRPDQIEGLGRKEVKDGSI